MGYICWNYFSKHAILADSSLQDIVHPTKIIYHDWMHALLCQGVLSSCLYNLLEAMDCWSNLHGWLGHWHVPSAFQNFKPVCLQPKRVEKYRRASKISSTASELLTILPLVSHYLDAIQAGATSHKAGVLCFQALNLLVEQFGATWQKAVLPHQIGSQAETSLHLWKETGWHMIRKHRWLLHPADNFRNHGCMPNCVAMERKNKVAGQQATAIQNTRNYEESILHELLAQELTTVTLPDTFDQTIALLRPKAIPKKLLPMARAIWPTIKEPCNGVSTPFTATNQHNAICAKDDVVPAICLGSHLKLERCCAFYHSKGNMFASSNVWLW